MFPSYGGDSTYQYPKYIHVRLTLISKYYNTGTVPYIYRHVGHIHHAKQQR